MSENKFVSAYDAFVKNLHDALEGVSGSVSQGLEVAKEKTSELGGLTQEEINKVSDYVKRDLEDAAQSLSDDADNNSLAEWFKFDVQLIENFALEAFLSLTDKTRIELLALEQRAKQTLQYHAGEVVSPGTLSCTTCQQEITFRATSEIPVCSHCQGKSFQRC